MEFAVITLLNGVAYGLLLFMLSSGLTLVFSMMGVLNFAHASFYMLGAYIGFSLTRHMGFWPALIVAPLLVGGIGALVERFGLREVHRHGHIFELLFTFGLAYAIAELVQIVWGRYPLEVQVPPSLQGPLFSVFGTTFPKLRAFMMLVALLMMASLWLLLTRTRIGLVVQAALTHPEAVENLGHNVPLVFMLVFATGSALAALAGVIGGVAFVTDPAMAAAVGSIIFVVIIVGGLGSLTGALIASLLIGVVQTAAVTVDWSIADALVLAGVPLAPGGAAMEIFKPTVSQLAPVLPFLLLVLVLLFRPKGLLGTRET